MITFSIIQKSQLEGAQRMDAEYYQPEYLKLDNKLDSYGSQLKTFGEILEKKNSLTGGATPLGADYSNEGIKFLRVQNIMPGYFDFSDVVLIDKKIHDGYLKRSKLLDDDVLLTITGVSYGKSNVYKKIFGEANINQHSVRMHFVSSLISEYVSTFLNSKYGHFQSDRKITGNSRPALAYEEIKTYKIPLLSFEYQNKIKKIHLESLDKENESIELYSKAEGLLLEELELANFKPKDDLSFIANLSDVQESNRADSDFFQPKYEEIIRKIERYKGGFDLVKNQFNQNKTLSKKDKSRYNYVEISDVNISNGEIAPNKIAKQEIPANGKIVLHKNDLLISKVRPYRGAVSFIDFEAEDLLGSGAFTVLQEKSTYKKEVFMIFLKLDFIKDLLLKYNCGTSYPVIKDEDILNLEIPLIKSDIQEQVAELVRKSHEARKKSKELLDEAKRKVEEMIEKGSGN